MAVENPRCLKQRLSHIRFEEKHDSCSGGTTFANDRTRNTPQNKCCDERGSRRRVTTTPFKKKQKTCSTSSHVEFKKTIEQQQNSRRPPPTHHTRDPHLPTEPLPNSGSNTTHSNIIFAANLEPSPNCELAVSLPHELMLHETVLSPRIGPSTHLTTRRGRGKVCVPPFKMCRMFSHARRAMKKSNQMWTECCCTTASSLSATLQTTQKAAPIIATTRTFRRTIFPMTQNTLQKKGASPPRMRL